MNKTPQQIAEEFARKCADKIALTEDCRNAVSGAIGETIPLVQLLECARLLKSCEWIGAMLTSERPPLLTEIGKALYNLDERL